jgi:hypothetical protein
MYFRGEKEKEKSLGSGLKTYMKGKKDKLTFLGMYPNANVNVSWLKVFLLCV